MVFAKTAAPHKTASGFIVAIGEHFISFLADRCPIFIDFDGVRDGFRSSAFAVKVNESTDFSVLEKRISRKVIHSRVKAHIFYREQWHMRFQLMKGDQCTDGIMASGAGETKKQRDVCVQFTVVAGELEQGIAVIILVKVTVPAPGSIGVRIMAWCRIIGRTADRRGFTAAPCWGGMSMDSRAIAGNSRIFRGNQTTFEGGYNSHKIDTMSIVF